MNRLFLKHKILDKLANSLCEAINAKNLPLDWIDLENYWLKQTPKEEQFLDSQYVINCLIQAVNISLEEVKKEIIEAEQSYSMDCYRLNKMRYCPDLYKAIISIVEEQETQSVQKPKKETKSE